MDRYKETFINNKHRALPFVKLPKKSTDKQYFYSVGSSRLDKISNDFYGNPIYGWLIMMANPQYGALEINIPDQTILNVPYPLQASLLDYNSAINNYFNLYGY
jgi:hypothetical protein